MKYDLIIWDFNGTIIDDVDVCYDILKELLTLNNLKIVSKEDYLDNFTFPVINYYQAVGFDTSKYQEISITFNKLYQQRWQTCKTYPQIIEVFNKIKSLGIKQIVLSASEINNLKTQLQHLNILNYFDAVLGLDNIYANSKLQVGLNYIKENDYQNKRILFVGDSLHDLEVAKSLNATPILVSYGHTSKKRLLNKNCQVIDSISEIIKYID